MTISAGLLTDNGSPVDANGAIVAFTQITNFWGPDKLVGMRILPNTGPRVLYWENIKSLDVQRMANTAILSIEKETQEYIGFGRESWKDADVKATLFLYEEDPLSLEDEDTLDGFLDNIHTNTNQYFNSSQTDTVAGYPVVWVKITDERREEFLRGIILYEITFQVRIYISGSGE
jgi:hypothetical protein